MRHPCIVMPAYGMPPGWTPPPDLTPLVPVAPTPARSGGAGADQGPAAPFVSRHPCRLLPALPAEIVAAYAVKA